MKKIFAIIAVVVMVMACGYTFAQEAKEGAVEAKAPATKVYVCNADKVSMDAPGKCPIRGMELVEKEAPAAPAEETVPASEK